jgi:hypothetical protein
LEPVESVLEAAFEADSTGRDAAVALLRSIVEDGSTALKVRLRNAESWLALVRPIADQPAPFPSVTLLAHARAAAFRNRAVRTQAGQLLRGLDDALTAFRAVALPRLDAREQDDGSAVLEWKFADRRLAFTLEPEARDSGWHLVSLPSAGGVLASGALHGLELWPVLAFALHSLPRG